MTALRVLGLNWGYSHRLLLKDLSLEVKWGQVATVLGRNGSGKSTLLRLLAGLLPLPPDTVFLEGRDVSRLSPSWRGRRIGYLPQFHTPAFPLPALEVVVTGRAARILFRPAAEDYRRAWEALEVLSLTHLAHRPYTELSGGERQLVLLARLLAQDAGVFLLDEPLAHLDLGHQLQLLKLFRQWAAQGRAVVVVLHDPTLALACSDLPLFLHEGQLENLPAEPEARARFLSRLYQTPLKLLQEGAAWVVLPDLAHIR